MLAVLTVTEAKNILWHVCKLAESLAGQGITATQDMAGQMLGRLIADRKFLATFYTLPVSALLLAKLAVARLPVDWTDPAAVTELRVADLACGTGALLSATYGCMATRVHRTGQEDRALHAPLMEQVLIGADIMPAAVHLTATMLSSIHLIRKSEPWPNLMPVPSGTMCPSWPRWMKGAENATRPARAVASYCENPPCQLYSVWTMPRKPV